MALRNSVFDRKGIMPEPEKELYSEPNADKPAPLSMTNDQTRIFLLHRFQPKKLGLLQTLGERLNLRRLQLESASPTTIVSKAETPRVPGEGSV